MKLGVEVEGFDELKRNFELYGYKLNRALGPAVMKGAEVVKVNAKSRINNRTGELASSITAAVTWDKNQSKAFAACFADAEPVFAKGAHSNLSTKKVEGNRYYIPNAVEYGHRAPGGGGVTVLATDKEGNYKTYTRGKKKGQLKAAASSKQNKVTKPQHFMQKAYKDPFVRARVQKIVADAIAEVIAKGGV